MTDQEHKEARAAEREIVRLVAKVAALERRLAAAEGSARAAITARDIAVRLAARTP